MKKTKNKKQKTKNRKQTNKQKKNKKKKDKKTPQLFPLPFPFLTSPFMFCALYPRYLNDSPTRPSHKHVIIFFSIASHIGHIWPVAIYGVTLKSHSFILCPNGTI